jgi:two-component system chemotaxis response regulator CheB
MTRVLIVDDLALSREQLTDYFEDAGLTVVGTAGTGREALQLVAEREPDVVTMDVKMPGMDGIETTRRIMDEQPTPVVVISRLTKEGAETTLSALEAGAVDHFHKLAGDDTVNVGEYKEQLVETVEQAATVEPEQLVRADATVDTPSPVRARADVGDVPPTVVIASSTGGVGLLQQHLRRLPPETDLRVIVVQHLRDDMTSQFASRLDDKTAWSVFESTEREQVGPGEVVVAHGGTHLEVTGDDGTNLQLSHTDEPTDSPVVPAADVTMTSAAAVVDDTLVGVVLTGLGNDGTAGARAIAEAGGTVIAQSAASSPADWMPRHVREAGLADYVCDADQLVETITGALRNTTDHR